MCQRLNRPVLRSYRPPTRQILQLRPFGAACQSTSAPIVQFLMSTTKLNSNMVNRQPFHPIPAYHACSLAHESVRQQQDRLLTRSRSHSLFYPSVHSPPTHHPQAPTHKLPPTHRPRAPTNTPPTSSHQHTTNEFPTTHQIRAPNHTPTHIHIHELPSTHPSTSSHQRTHPQAPINTPTHELPSTHPPTCPHPHLPKSSHPHLPTSSTSTYPTMSSRTPTSSTDDGVRRVRRLTSPQGTRLVTIVTLTCYRRNSCH